MVVYSRQPLAKGKDVHREVESEGSRRQNPAPRNTNRIRHIGWDEVAKQIEVRRLYRHWSVSRAGTWSERMLLYHSLYRSAGGGLMDVPEIRENELDKLLTQRGHQFVRYSDGM